MIFRELAARTFINAQENSIYGKLYRSKMTEESFSKHPKEAAIKEFLEKQNSVFYAYLGHIPMDTICKVKYLCSLSKVYKVLKGYELFSWNSSKDVAQRTKE